MSTEIFYAIYFLKSSTCSELFYNFAAAYESRLAPYFFVLIFGTSSTHQLLHFNDLLALYISMILQIYGRAHSFNNLYKRKQCTLASYLLEAGGDHATLLPKLGTIQAPSFLLYYQTNTQNILQ